MNKNPFKKKKKLKFVTEKGKKSRKRKIIIISFIVVILLLGTASLLYFLKTYDYDFSKAFGKKDDTSDEEKSNVKLKGKSTIMFAATSKDDELYFVSLVQPDMDDVQVAVTCLPVDSMATVNGKSQSLNSSYINGGAKDLFEATKSYTGINIDRYIIVNEKNIKPFVSRLGGFKLTLDEKISYNEDDFILNLLKGKQTLTGDNLLNYIVYQKKKGGDYLNNQALIICDMIDQMIASKNFYKDDETYDKLVNLVESDISIVDYTKSKEMIIGYIESEKRQKSISVDLATLKK